VVLELDRLAAIEVHVDTEGGSRTGALSIQAAGGSGLTRAPAEDGWARAAIEGATAVAGERIEIVVAATGDPGRAPRLGLRRDGHLALRTVHRP
jgi:hypothetical protein